MTKYLSLEFPKQILGQIGAYNIGRLILTKVVSLALLFILIFPNSNHLISILS